MVKRSKNLNKEERLSRFLYPRPPLLRNFTKEIGKFKVKVKGLNQNPLTAAAPPAEGLNAGAFFGASPVVASALDLRVGRDPFADRIENNMRFESNQVKAEVFTLQKTGGFYFALTKRPKDLTLTALAFIIPSMMLLPITAF